MTRPGPDGADRRARGWWVAAIVLAGVAATALGAGLHAASTTSVEPPGAPETSVASDPTSEAVVSGPSSQAAAPAASAASPVSIRIPAIDAVGDVIQLGLNDDKTVEVPTDPDQAGWYRLGPPPGQLGSAVILGHVDSTTGPAVFYRLKHLEAGDGIRVRLSDRSVAHFAVRSLATYQNEDFPAQRVYAGSPRSATLVLVTCGGDYDSAAGGYQSNVVVYADLVR